MQRAAAFSTGVTPWRSLFRNSQSLWHWRMTNRDTVLVFLPLLLVLLIPERNRLHVDNVSVEPLVAPKPPENGHAADPILAHCNFMESTSTRNDFPIVN
jgi:hypothetical protein